MLDIVNLQPPPVLKKLEDEARAIHFTMGSDYQTGALLRVLAASKPGGTLLELGTGVGFSAAWMLDGMDVQARLVTVDSNASHLDIARRFLGHDSRITFTLMDGAAFLNSMLAQGRQFDLLFADMPPGKFQHVDEALRLLRPGGFYIIDDLLFLTSWEEAHATQVYRLVAYLESREDLKILKLNWSTGLLVAVKIAV